MRVSDVLRRERDTESQRKRRKRKKIAEQNLFHLSANAQTLFSGRGNPTNEQLRDLWKELKRTTSSVKADLDSSRGRRRRPSNRDGGSYPGPSMTPTPDPGTSDGESTDTTSSEGVASDSSTSEDYSSSSESSSSTSSSDGTTSDESSDGDADSDSSSSTDERQHEAQSTRTSPGPAPQPSSDAEMDVTAGEASGYHGEGSDHSDVEHDDTLLGLTFGEDIEEVIILNASLFLS